MELKAVITRARRGFRDDLRLHAVAVASLVVAFLCLGTALLSVENLNRVAERWSRTQHVTIYLRDQARPDAVAQLRLVLESLREVKKVEHVSSEHARQLFAEQTQLSHGVSALPSEAFPASLELELNSGVSAVRVDKLAQRIQQFEVVEEVETYRAFIDQFHKLLDAGRSGAALLAVLVLICVVAVIANTIRLAIANRRREIEVLKLCGATDAFVRSPFLLEGAVQAVLSASLAMLLLLLGYVAARGQVEASLTSLTGVPMAFLSATSVLAVIGSAALIGGLGSALSLRRYLQV
jgi:cell division transport system permease protein